MGSIFISDWKFGMDRRRKRVAGVPGTLWDGKNVVINRGGDIERTRRFVPTYTLPTGKTFGLGAVRGQLYAFGSLASGFVTMPTGVQYQQLAAPSGAAMTQVLDVRAAGGSLYVIARYADGEIHHFYNGTRVTDWDALGEANSDYTTLAAYMAELLSSDATVSATAVGDSLTITAVVPGTAFTIAKSTTDIGGTTDQDITLATVQANVPAVAEVQATTLLTFLAGTAGTGHSVNDITINGVSLMAAAVLWATSNTVTAAAVAAQINNLSATHGYLAAAALGVITVTAAVGTGTTSNNYAVAADVGGDILIDTPSMAGGVAAVAGVAQVVTATFAGAFEAKDRFVIYINGTPYAATGRAAGTGVSAYVVKKRVYSPAASLWEYCALNDFDDWNDAGASSGSGFLNVSNDAEGAERLVGAGTYITQSAVFSRRNIRVYDVSTDAAQTVMSQPIDNSGALAARSIVGYGTTDLFYLDEPGIRSLRARDASGAPFVNDIGVAIDPFVRAHLDTLSQATIMKACAVVEPREGRFWMALGNRIYALSFFPGSQISAWTYIEPGFNIDDFARAYSQLYVRGGDTVYLYGGPTGLTYPNANETIATVGLPYVSSSPPGMNMMAGFDIASEGNWTTELLLDPNNEALAVNVGTVTNVTYPNADIPTVGRSTHMALSMTCAEAGAASISNLTIHTDGKEKNG